jgi:hypothetical protein
MKAGADIVQAAPQPGSALGRLFLQTPVPFLGSAIAPGRATGLAEFYLVLPAGRAAARRVEPLALVPQLLLDGICEGFITLHTKKHLILHGRSPQIDR